MKKQACIICGYVYDGALPFDELPNDYVCPICGVTKNKFAVITHDFKEAFLKINYGCTSLRQMTPAKTTAA